MEAVAQSAWNGKGVQTGELIRRQVVPGDAPLTTEIAWIRPRVDRAYRRDEAKPVGGSDFSASPTASERYGILGNDEGGTDRCQGLGADEVLLHPTQPGAAECGHIAANQRLKTCIGGLGKQDCTDSR